MAFLHLRKMKKAILFVFVFLVKNISSYAQFGHTAYLNDAVTSREHPLDITHLKLDVRFDALQKKVIGNVSHSFVVLRQSCDSVFFDAPGIEIQSVKCCNSEINYTKVKNGIWMYFGQTLKVGDKGQIDIQYTATPNRGIYFIGWNQETPKQVDPWTIRKQIWTQGQGIDNRNWIPMYDDMNDKFTTETIIHFDEDYKVLSNGKLVEKKKESNHQMMWHYTMIKPHAGYLLMLAIGHYDVSQTQSKRGVPVNYWYYPECKDRMPSTFRNTPEMIDFMERETGINYPWESYSQVMVQDFIYGAMENTTATIFGDFFNTDDRAALDRSYEEVNMHELTHQWFGDFVTARDSRDSWLQESFATYWPKQFALFKKGNDEYEWICRNHQNSAVEAGKKDIYPVHHSMGGTARNYPKGAAVISMLEYVLGKEQWKRVLNHYLKQHAYANVETHDLMQACKDAAGINLDWFFDEWILRGGEPVFDVSYSEVIKNNANIILMQVEQNQVQSETVGLFKMPVDIEIGLNDGSKMTKQIWVSKANEYFEIEIPKNNSINYIVFDAGSRLIKTLHLEKEPNLLLHQAEKATHYIDRYDAIVALRSQAISLKREVLLKVLSKEKHFGIRNEIISQLGSDKESTSVLLALNNYQSHSSTRNTLMQNLDAGNTTLKTTFIQALNDSSYDVVKTALEKLCYAYPTEALTYLKKCENEMGMHQNLRLKVLELSVYFNINKEQALKEITLYVSPTYEFRTRLQAINILKSLNFLSEEVAMHLFQVTLCSNTRLSGPASDCINHFNGQVAYHQLLLNSAKKDELKDSYEGLKKVFGWLR